MFAFRAFELGVLVPGGAVGPRGVANATVLQRIENPRNKTETILKEWTKSESRENKSANIPEFRMEKLRTAIDCLKRGKSWTTGRGK